MDNYYHGSGDDNSDNSDNSLPPCVLFFYSIL